MDLRPGVNLGPYRVVSLLGVGGMGEVYRASDSRLGRDVAIKVLPAGFAADSERLSRFEREARATAALSHPNILAVFDIGTHEGKPYLVEELLEGESLRERLERGAVTVPETVEIAIQVARGLAAAHAKRIVHRDLKPGNVFITKDGTAKILDFGLAKLVQGTPLADVDTLTHARSTATESGRILGTVAYMAPEQARGMPVDPRADIFSFGVVLYEMLSGRRPFRGETATDTVVAILKEAPPPLPEDVPPALQQIVSQCLEKSPEHRFPSAHALVLALRTHSGGSEAPARATEPGRAARRFGIAWIAIAAAVVVAATVGGWYWHRASRERWALETAAPEIARLTETEEFNKAAALLIEARLVLPKDPTLEKLWLNATWETSFETVPAGADVSMRPYTENPNAWQSLGKTPLVKTRLPLTPTPSSHANVFRYAKPGFVTRYDIGGPDGPEPLDPEGSIPADMVRVPVFGGTIAASVNGLNQLPGVPASHYLIDRTEVTNEEYSKFVEAGGYQRREFWRQPFVKDGRTIPWETAVALFVDSTGRPGPGTWEAGILPDGLGKHPVAGVSWYEAAAYAEFAGKSLPTVYHWSGAVGVDLAPVIAPGSNFRDAGTVAVGGQGALGRFGTYDMAGNVKEWCWNESSGGTRFILGGGFGEPSYMFIQADAQSPWDRRPNIGFRCVMLPETASPGGTGRIEFAIRDFAKDKPISDEVFNAFKGLYAYDKGELDARVEETVATEDGTRERISFKAAYGGERVVAYLFLPKHAVPPYQTIVYFPGAVAIWAEKFDSDDDFLVKSGRALMYPLYKGTHERRDGLKSWSAEPTAFYRDHMIAWSKDLARSIDYLETRRDIDIGRLAYDGFCWGTEVAPVMLALENRFKTAILEAGGLMSTRAFPEADQINFVPRVKIPVLMLNGRYDAIFPPVSSQLPLFQRLGTSEKNKKRVIYESGHDLPRKEMIRETLAWLDTYLGPVKR